MEAADSEAAAAAHGEATMEHYMDVRAVRGKPKGRNVVTTRAIMTPRGAVLLVVPLVGLIMMVFRTSRRRSLPCYGLESVFMLKHAV